MKVSAVRFMLSAFAALAVTGVVHATAEDAAAAADSDVKVLNADNFKEWADAQEIGLVEFYAPWCGHCKALAPEYEKAATSLKEENISLAKVDCTENQALCEEMQIPGFPTLKIVKGGDFDAYNGTRKEAGIVSYMRKQLLPALSELSSDNFNKFTVSDRVVIVGFIEDTASPEYAELESLAKELRDEYTFGVVTDKELAAEQGIAESGVVVYKTFDDGKDVFEGDITADALRSFVKASSVPIFDEISGENYSMYAQTGLPFAFAFFDSDESRKLLEEQIYPVAKQHKGAINFVLIDANKYASQADHLNLKHEWPAFAIQNQGNLAKFPFPQDKEITEESIESFVKDFTNDKLAPSYKSEPIPETNDKGVFVLVSDQFEEVAMDKNKDVLVEFYAPWCGHCKRLVPIYDKLGDVLKSNENLVIAKMDAIANDIPSSDPALQIQGFPTIVLIRGDDNSVVEYHGNRSVESFIEFLEENAANSITYDKAALAEEEDEDEKEKEQVVVKKDNDDEVEVEVEVDAETEVEVVAEDEDDRVPADKAESDKQEDDGHDEL
ncbi:protein disulfide-isomerase precursor [Coemansia interrupta]|uniref:Protein disulfide-isomerase n=1 Tax=Coemansia interrupta TaxID=1126814 RepID=A0A9W8HCE6_9FUNG|nr:protein disulfide-isomerase precursor [Coemansia interrupta]